MKYIVLHAHPENLVMSQFLRDQLFKTGNVLDVKECPTFSLQSAYLRGFTVRPLTVILWGMRDRYDVATELGITCISVDRHADACSYCQGLRPHARTFEGEEGRVHDSISWEPMGE